MSAIHNVRAFVARWRWSLGVTGARVNNRWWDLVGYAAGFCMKTTWQAERATYSPGHKSWRCWVLRKAHQGPHRTGTYRWSTGGKPIYDPLPAGVVWSRVRPGAAPRWLSGRHRDVGTRRRDRVAVRAAFERIRAAAGEIAPQRIERVSLGGEFGELGVLPFTGRLTDAEQTDLMGDRHDWHVHGPRPGLDPEHWDEQGKLRKGNDA